MLTRMLALVFSVGFFAPSSLVAATLEFGCYDGTLKLDVPPLQFSTTLFSTNWSGMKKVCNAMRQLESGNRKDASFQENDKDVLEERTEISALPNGGVKIRYLWTPVRDLELNQLVATFRLPASLLETPDSFWKFSHETGTFPLKKGPNLSRNSDRFVLCAGGKEVRFSFDKPVFCLIQDNRRFHSETYSFRFGFSHRVFRKGTLYEFSCDLTAAEPISIASGGPFVLRPGKEWIPLHYSKNIEPGSVLDFSGMGLSDTPAGKYGRVLVKDGHFEFVKRPGVRQRFYGVNFCSSGNFPEKAVADEVAERLRMLGYNAIRVHHHDNPLTADAPAGEVLNPKMADRLDYFLAACYKRGLYVTTDLFVSRRVKWRDVGIDKPGVIEQRTYKALAVLHEPTTQNLERYTRAFLTHVNPYTGRSYAEEPGLMSISLINENNISWNWQDTYALDCTKQEWKKWLAEKRAASAGKPSVPGEPSWDQVSELPPKNSSSGVDGSACAIFRADIERRFFRRMRRLIRDELHCEIPLTDQNCGSSTPMQSVRAEYDYVDEHFYVDHPHFLETKWRLPSRCANGNPLRLESLPMCGLAFTRLGDKPFTVSEFNFSGPGMYRGVGGILTGAMSSLQDWDGVWRFAYSHSDSNLPGNSPVHLGYFNLADDPLSQATDRAAICLFLRGDLPPLRPAATVEMSSAELGRLSATQQSIRRNFREPWTTKVSTRVDTCAVPGETAFRFAEVYTTNGVSEIFRDRLAANAQKPTGLSLNREEGSFTIDTPRTCGGFAESGAFTAGPLSVRISETPTTVWVSSVDGLELARSRRMLLSHVTDVQQEGITFAEKERQILLRWGTGDLIAREGRAEIRLRLEKPGAYTVYAVATSGKRLDKLGSTVKDGALCFTADIASGVSGAQLLYEIIQE
ncbi:MAG: hypothetical protein IJR99_04810 [Kiritimatiellae bacterium]|nr:hypothetical protein [Kiritimatiellia bacterium]